MKRASPLPTHIGLIGLIALSACGGTKNEARPDLLRDAAVEAFDECAAADGLEFKYILTFEPANKSTDLCDGSSNCTNLNYDSNDAYRCDVPWIGSDPLTASCPDGHSVWASPRECASNTPHLCLESDGVTPYPDDGSLMPSATNFCVPHENAAPPPGDVERCGQSGRAAHVVGRNLAICYSPRSHKPGWGGNYRITAPTNMPYDGTDWDGVSFWAKTGDGPTGTGILPHIIDPYTVGADKNSCNTNAKETVPDQAKCDPWGLSAVLTNTWRFYKMPFSEVRQKGFGMASALGHIDQSTIRAVEFTFNPGDWDFWVDDVALYREKR